MLGTEFKKKKKNVAEFIALDSNIQYKTWIYQCVIKPQYIVCGRKLIVLPFVYKWILPLFWNFESGKFHTTFQEVTGNNF